MYLAEEEEGSQCLVSRWRGPTPSMTCDPVVTRGPRKDPHQHGFVCWATIHFSDIWIQHPTKSIHTLERVCFDARQRPSTKHAKIHHLGTRQAPASTYITITSEKSKFQMKLLVRGNHLQTQSSTILPKRQSLKTWRKYWIFTQSLLLRNLSTFWKSKLRYKEDFTSKDWAWKVRKKEIWLEKLRKKPR